MSCCFEPKVTNAGACVNISDVAARLAACVTIRLYIPANTVVYLKSLTQGLVVRYPHSQEIKL